MRVSVCSTSFNCAEAIEGHCRSVFSALTGLEYEYIIVDNRSRDGTFELLRDAALENPRLSPFQERCSRGKGRQRAVELASFETILSIDVDTIYRPELRIFLDSYADQFLPKGLALQAIYAGLYPRELWFRAGGMRDLNFAEDFDLWMRIWRLGRMRWTPVFMGENKKPIEERDANDVLSHRYSRHHRLSRVLRREIDFWRTREYARLDLASILKTDVVDIGLGELQSVWFDEGGARSARHSLSRVAHQVHAILTDRS